MSRGKYRKLASMIARRGIHRAFHAPRLHFHTDNHALLSRINLDFTIIDKSCMFILIFIQTWCISGTRSIVTTLRGHFMAPPVLTMCPNKLNNV